MPNRRRQFPLALIVVLVLVLSACGSGSNTSTSTMPIDSSYAPKSSAKAALSALLEAEQKGDHKASFALLGPDARKTYKDSSDWAAHREENTKITSFAVDSDEGNDRVGATVHHDPGLDSFHGLSFATEKQTWTAVHVSKGWLLQPEPATQPQYPSDGSAQAAAKAWVEAVQACDQAKARSLQAIDTLFATNAPTLCKVSGEVKTGAVEKLAQGPNSADIVAQYTQDALTWSRVVTVLAPVTIHVVLVPIGNDWKVIGLYQ